MTSGSSTPVLSQQRAKEFADKWQHTKEEERYAKSFWTDFFRQLCGVDDEKIAGIEFEYPVQSVSTGRKNRIDVYWKNTVLIEHKSKGEDLDRAELQARGYLRSLPKGYQPKTLIICDFTTFRIIDVRQNRTQEFLLKDLPKHINKFKFIISGNRPQFLEDEIEVDQKAAKLMANLYIELEKNNYGGHETSVFLSRLLFLLFGDDTNMWEHNLVKKILFATAENGSDVGETLSELFEFLNTSDAKRKKSEKFKGLPYINGGIFAENIQVIKFNKGMRAALIDAANYDWSGINPTIFGALFQLIKSKEERAALGEHYTSEENINKIIYPLFLDNLQERLTDAWSSKKELKKLRQDLAKIKIFDPACGCGNFLVVSYRHLRQLELELIVRLNNLEGTQDSLQLDGSMGLSVTLNQLYGIEIEEWPAQVARMALFLTEHQENLKLERITGESPKQFPIKNSTHIVIANSLSFDWNKLVTADENLKIIGNPPFLGRVREKTQTTELIESFDGAKGSGNIDYVCAWYAKAAKFIGGSKTKVAFVSTNSIVQGEQPGILWEFLKRYNLGIDFAYQTFPWTNDASGQAAVYCVIIGFSDQKENNQNVKRLFDSNSLEYKHVNSINRYLLDAPDRSIRNRKDALSPSLPKMKFGSMPHDGGFLLLSVEEKQEIITSEPEASKFIRKLVGADELINNLERYCIWVKDEEAILANRIKSLRLRAEKVRKTRLESPSADAVAAASRPLTFKARRQPTSTYIAVPSVSSDKRVYIPIAVYPPEVIVTNLLLTIDCATDEIFALLNSSIFNIWNRKVSGRLGNAARVSAEITYNNFPVPELTGEQIDLLSTTGRDILNVRETFGAVKLAELYDPISMPEALRKAHDANDKVSLKIYGLSVKSNQDEILSRLFEIYEKLDNVNKLSV